MSYGALKHCKKQVGDACPRGALKHRKTIGGGRMSLGCSQTWQKLGIHFQIAKANLGVA
jgi:hypothetical protein